MSPTETQGFFSCPVCLLCNYSDCSGAMADARAHGCQSVTMEKTNTHLGQTMGLEVPELPDFVALHNTSQ